jgi:hypothetical protein
MSTATGTAVIDPKVYVPKFMEYARKNDIAITTEALQQWDAEVNKGLMEAAILAKYGQVQLVKIAIRQLFQQYLYNANIVRIAPSSSNPEGLKQGVDPFSGIQRGIHVPSMTTSGQETLIAVQTEKFKEAGRRLKAYGLPLKKLHSLIEEL